MTINEVENKLKVLSHIVDDDFVKAVEWARRYLALLKEKEERIKLLEEIIEELEGK